MMPQPINPHALELAYLSYLDAEAKAYQREVLRARDYHSGNHPVYLTARLKQFLNLPDSADVFRMNLCGIVVEAVAERLIIAGLDCPEAQSAEWAAGLWAASGMAVRANEVHETTIRDREGFVIVDWDVAQKRARLTADQRYTSTEANGDGYGCQAYYENDDPAQALRYVVKRWTETVEENGQRVQRQRATFYYPDSVEKYAYARGGWQPLQEEGDEAWPLPWVNKAGEPLGVAVIHFRNKDLQPEARDAWPLQDALNKAVVDLVASADAGAFPMFKVFGFYPTTDGAAPESDGSNLMGVGPGQFVGSTKSPQEASFEAMEPADLTQLRELKHDFALDIATVTNTPAHRFQISGQVAAEGTLKQQEEPLMAKVRLRQAMFGEAWSAVYGLARKLENLFGVGGLDETAAFAVRWKDAQARTDAERFAEWDAKQKAGIPKRQLWLEMGYTPEQVETMLADPEVRLGTFAAYPGA